MNSYDIFRAKETLFEDITNLLIKEKVISLTCKKLKKGAIDDIYFLNEVENIDVCKMPEGQTVNIILY